jgi:hypothetical protein
VVLRVGLQQFVSIRRFHFILEVIGNSGGFVLGTRT